MADPDYVREMGIDISNNISNSIEDNKFRVQIGAFNVILDKQIFDGIENVVSFTDSDSLIRYMSGSFKKYSDAVEYQAEMIARGFDDAFIVTYKNGVRIGMNYQLKNKNKKEFSFQSMVDEYRSYEEKYVPSFSVQVDLNIPKLDLPKLQKIDG